jgi:hypothetical protein
MTIRLIEGFDYYLSIAGTAGVNSAWTFDSTAASRSLRAASGVRPSAAMRAAR